MKKLLTGLLLCTLFVTLGAASAMAQSVADPIGFADDSKVLSSKDMAAYDAADLDVWVSGDYGITSVDLTAASLDLENVSAEKGLITVDFTGVLDEDGKIVNCPAADSKDLFGHVVLEVVSNDFKFHESTNVDASSTFFVYTGSDFVTSSDVASADVALYPLFADGKLPTEPVTFSFFVPADKVTNYKVTYGWKTTVTVNDKASAYETEAAAIANPKEVVSTDIEVLNSDLWSVFSPDITDGAVELMVVDSGDLTSENLMSGDLKASFDIAMTDAVSVDVLDWNTFQTETGDDASILALDTKTKKIYMAFQVTSPDLTNPTAPKGSTLAISNNGEYEATNFIAWVPVAEKVASDDYKFLYNDELVAEQTIFWQGKTATNTGDDIAAYAAKTFSVSLVSQTGATEEADTIGDLFAEDAGIVDAEYAALVMSADVLEANITDSDDYDGLETFLTENSADIVNQPMAFELTDGDDVEVSFAGTASKDITLAAVLSSDVTINPVVTNVANDDGIVRVDIFLPESQRDSLGAGDALWVNLPEAFPADDEEFVFYMNGVEVDSAKYYVSEIDGLVFAFTSDGGEATYEDEGVSFEFDETLKFSDLGGSLFAYEIEGVTPTPATGSSGGCSVASIAPFALLLVAPLALLRK